MSGYLLQRLFRLVAVLFGVSLLTFSVLHLIPGDQSQSAYDNRLARASLLEVLRNE